MNIWEIQNNLQAIFDAIEDAGGEITPEQEEQLSITEKDLKDKLEQYQHVIARTTADINCAHDEIDRLEDIIDSKQKLINKLKSIILSAITKFGVQTKTGGYQFDTGIMKFSTRKTEAIGNVDDTFVSSSAEAIKNILCNINYFNDGSYDILDKHKLLCHISNIYFGKDGLNDPTSFKDSDLDDINIALTINVPLSELTTESGSGMVNSLAHYVDSVKTSAKLNKTDLKNKIKNEGYQSNLGTLETNYSLQIK